jgi:hypothetical protein
MSQNVMQITHMLEVASITGSATWATQSAPSILERLLPPTYKSRP